MELSHNLDLDGWKRHTAGACYSSVATAQKGPVCMMSASGEVVCNPAVTFIDGASHILGRAQNNKPTPSWCGTTVTTSAPTIETYADVAQSTEQLQKCIDGTRAMSCVKQTIASKQQPDGFNL